MADRRAAKIVTFLAFMVASTIVAEVIWDSAVMDRLYHCTDALGLNYIFGPSSWVHGRFVGNRSDTGDTIAPGWSMDLLILLWLSFIAGSIVVSACGTMLICRDRGRADPRRGFEPIQRD